MAEAKRKKAGKRSKPGKSRARRIWGRIGLSALVLFLVVGLTGMGTFFYLYSSTDLPDPNGDFTTNTTFIYYNDGRNELGSLAVQNRQTLEYSAMPQVIKDAVVAAENRTFWEDPGFSLSGIARGAFSIATGGEVQGGSTITQQYIKIYYLDSERTLTRKVSELMLAIKMGRELPKEEILEGYLNTIYFGRGAYGIQAAARSYFLKDAAELTMPEAAALAAILNNPAGFNPSGEQEKVDALEGRYQYVLGGLLEMEKISQAEHDEAATSLPEFPAVPVNDRYGGPKGFLIKMVEEELAREGFDESMIAGGGLKITTTLDKGLQTSANTIAAEYTQQAAEDAQEPQDPDELHVALSSVDTTTGGILALYGGPDYVENNRNWATTKRPAASTFKVFAAVAGMRNGFSLESVLKGDTFTPRGDSKTIRNEFSYQYGPVTLRRAVAESINTAFVDMTEQIDGGPDEVIQAANDAGAPGVSGEAGWSPNNRIALGAAEVSPVNMANAYATFADSGKYKPAHIVATVEDAQGVVVYEADTAAQQNIDPNIAANMTDALTSVVSEGTGRGASELGRPVAGKTGTHGVEDEIQSAWFVGYTRQISTAVMFVVGDDGIGDLDEFKRPQDGTFFGSSYPLMTWVDFMTEATEGMEVLDFDEPRPLEGRAETRATESQSSRPAERSEAPSPTPEETETPTPSPSPSEVETPSEEPTPTVQPSETEEPEPEPEPTSPAPAPTPTRTTPQPTAVPTQQPTQPQPTRVESAAPPAGNDGAQDNDAVEEED
ncbi:MAG: transglycosylase domain-containing protein [Arachnia sp.]